MCVSPLQLWTARLSNALQSPGVGLEVLEEKGTGV